MDGVLFLATLDLHPSNVSKEVEELPAETFLILSLSSVVTEAEVLSTVSSLSEMVNNDDVLRVICGLARADVLIVCSPVIARPLGAVDLNFPCAISSFLMPFLLVRKQVAYY